jgi:glycolate oxidase FAD binding subunit
VVPVGGGTRLHLGGFLDAPSFAAVDLARLDRVVDHAADDLTITVEPGITLARLGQVLAAHGQWIPLDPPFPETATVGGMVATGASGPLRPAGETPRRHLIGIAVMDGAGVVHRAGGRVVKNVAGYDLMKLQTGALGTLGLIVEMSFRVHPLPEMEVLRIGRAEGAGRLADLARRINKSDLEPSVFVACDSGTAAEMHGDTRFAAPIGVAIGFLGFREDVEWCERELERLAAEAGLVLEHRAAGSAAAALRGRLRLNPAPGEVELRSHGLPTTTFDRLHALVPAPDVSRAGAGNLLWFLACPRSGTVRVLHPAGAAPDATTVTAARRAVAAHGGSLVVEACPDDLAREVDVWGPPGSGLELMAGLKKALDPDRRFNPGRFAGGL